MFEDGLNPEDLLGRKFGHHLNFWSMSDRKLTQRIDLGDQHQMVLEVRPAHDPAKAWGSSGWSSASRTLGSVFLWHQDGDRWAATKVITIPAEPADPDLLPRPQALRGGAPAGQRHRPVSGRPLAVRVVLGHRRAQAVRRQRPIQPARDRVGPPGRHRRPPAPPSAPDQRLRGGPQMVEISRDGRRVYVTNSLYAAGTTSSTPTASAPGWPSSTPTPPPAGWRRPAFFPNGEAFRGLRVHQTRLQGGDASSDSYCYTS